LSGNFGYIDYARDTGFFEYAIEDQLAFQGLSENQLAYDVFTINVISSNPAVTSIDYSFEVELLGKNDLPSNFVLSTSTLNENQSYENIGRLSAFDAENDVVTFRLGDSNDSTLFNVSEDGFLSTKTAMIFDHEVQDIYQIEVIASDPYGAVSDIIHLAISDQNDIPEIETIPTLLMLEDCY
jgi:hypothetical protein